MKRVFILIATLFIGVIAYSQNNFIDFHKSYARFNSALKNRTDSLKKQAINAGFDWPLQQIYIRSFKYDSYLEVWARNNSGQPFKLFKSYKVCALSGALGPKRMEGDYQVPEGFYMINEFNPKSSFHLSLGLNYPNAADALLSDSLRPGGEIYIHGTCITVGCIPIMNDQIEELYVLAANARNNGQDFIPVHIFPIKFGSNRSKEILQNQVQTNPGYADFLQPLKKAYDYFEKNKQLPLIAVGPKGEYIVL